MDRAVELASMIQNLRAELTQAMAAGADEQLRFELGTVQLNLTVAVESSAEPGVKVRFWVIEAGGDMKRSNASTQHIQLTLEPRLAGHPEQRPWVAGAAVQDER